jgi:hypothetical protein
MAIDNASQSQAPDPFHRLRDRGGVNAVKPMGESRNMVRRNAIT